MPHPPGFEGEPRYKQKTPLDIQTQTQMTKYSDIQATCAKKMHIFLPMGGYTHTTMEEDNIEKLYELAYQREFQSRTGGVPAVKTSPYNPLNKYPSSR